MEGVAYKTFRRDVAKCTLPYRKKKRFKARGTGNGNGGAQGGFLNAVRSISDIGKTFSHGRNLAKADEGVSEATAAATCTPTSTASPAQKSPTLQLPKVGGKCIRGSLFAV